MKYAQRFLLVLLLLMLGPAVVAADEPNVLFISIDDLNDWTGLLGGHPQAQTPNLDALMKRGMRFTNAHCSAPACAPSRTSLLLGMAPTTTGVYVNGHDWRRGGFFKDDAPLPMHFKANGYHAMGAGKIFHSDYKHPPSWDEYLNVPLTEGFVENVEATDNPAARRALTWGPMHIEDESKTGDALVARWVGQRLKREHDEPFFLAGGIYRPHVPWYVPVRYFDMFPLDEVQRPVVLEDDLADIPEVGRRFARRPGFHDHRHITEHDAWDQCVQAYLACVAYADNQIGKIVKSLDESGQADNTIIVVFSDHGWHLGEKEAWRKFTLWEESTRVPFAIIAPGITKPNSTSDAAVSLLDIYPTLVALCGLPTPKQKLEGRSLVPLLKDPAAAWDHAVVTTGWKGRHAVRDKRWRYIRYPNRAEELYDHDSDPNEWTNLAAEDKRAQYADVIERLQGFMPENDALPLYQQPRFLDWQEAQRARQQESQPQP